MNTKQKISITTLSTGAFVASYWAGYIYGSSHMPLQKAVLFFIIILPPLHLAIAWCFRLVKRNSFPPSSGSSRLPPKGPDVPVRKPPGGPPEIYCRHVV